MYVPVPPENRRRRNSPRLGARGSLSITDDAANQGCLLGSISEDQRRKRRPASDAESLINLVEVNLHRAFRHPQLLGYLSVRESPHDQRYDLALSCSKRLRVSPTRWHYSIVASKERHAPDLGFAEHINTVGHALFPMRLRPYARVAAAAGASEIGILP